MFNLKYLKKLCELNNIELKILPNNHYQLKGKLLVNYYPLSKNKTAYVERTKHSIKQVDIEQAVRMCLTQPKSMGKPEKRRKSYRKIRQKLHDKGVNNCCWCDAPININNSTVEHVIPLSTNGLDNENNIKLSCKKCNESRGNIMTELHD